MNTASSEDAVLTTHIPGLRRFVTGKVRDVYDLGDMLLLIASDRISAFDVVMPNGIPDKGKVLTQLSRFWFHCLRPLVATHYITTDPDFMVRSIAEAGGILTPDVTARLVGRAMLGVKAQALPIECVVRGYLAGSLWNEYRAAGGEMHAVSLHGFELPGGLRQSDKLPRPLFTPATKAETGHDENISLAQAGQIVGSDRVEQLQALSIALYENAAERARQSGIILADTKFEFGQHRGDLLLIDEALTPDSSRFWDAATYDPGRSQPSFDKQYVRDWLISSGWDREPPAPILPPEIVSATTARYREAYLRLVGVPLSNG